MDEEISIIDSNTRNQKIDAKLLARTDLESN